MSKTDWLTAEDLKKSMKDGIADARDTFVFGVDNPRRDTIAAAIEAIKTGIWEKNFKERVAKWERKLQLISLEDWKKATIAAASMYASRAADIGTRKWQEYYTNAKKIIEDAVEKYLKSKKEKADLIEFWKDMQKLRDI